jgi:UDP-N-acetylglucosamine 2-epimerase
MKIVTIVGARPQFIKVAPVWRAIQQHNLQGAEPQITEIFVHTGQHYDYEMSQVFFDQLEIPNPQHHLGIGSGTHGEMTGLMLSRIERVLVQEKPDWAIVYGDTNSTLAGALAASKLNIPLVHVEAGLRSFNRRMPEEINRVLTDHISAVLFCPTDVAVWNLRKEGIRNGVFNVGDVMYDAFLFCKDLALRNSRILPDLGLKPGNYFLATVHRQENTDDTRNLENIFLTFEQFARPDCPIIVPLHPRTQKALDNKKVERLNQYVRLIPPVSYLDMIALESQSRLILTDSGGVQKEAYFSGVPCVTLRGETEWIEIVESGWNYLGGTECKQIRAAFEKALHFCPGEQPRFYGEGQASHLILNHLLTFGSYS